MAAKLGIFVVHLNSCTTGRACFVEIVTEVLFCTPQQLALSVKRHSASSGFVPIYSGQLTADAKVK